MQKNYLIIIISFVLGIACFVTYNIIGSYVAEDGLLIEPFGLIPIGCLMFLIGIVSSLIWGVRHLFRKKQKR